MHILRLEAPPEEKDHLIAELWELGTTGIIEEDNPSLLCAFFTEPFDAAGFAPFNARWERAEDCDWVEVAQSQWHPVEIGASLFLAPAWTSAPTPPGRIRIDMDPGRACGTGWHPSTQLALEAMESRIPTDGLLLDLGAGSGILAAGAALLGARRIVACDIDPEAAVAAHNRLSREAPVAGVFAGSLRSVRDFSVNLLVANINAETLIELAADIRRVLKPGATALMTGFPSRHLNRMLAAFGPGETHEKSGWVLLIWRS